MVGNAQRSLDSVSNHLLVPQEPVIIGGMILDIHATPSINTSSRSTTPGKVQYMLGGVARNVAECMSKLGTKPYMISAVGLDMAGNMLLVDWKSSGLSLDGIRKHQDIETAVVSNIFDVNGELLAGIASVKAIESFLTPEWIQQSKGIICSAPIVMVDANLNSSALEASCQMAAEASVPVWFEPVSVAKSQRIASIAKYVTFVSPNEDELIAMANALSGGDIFSQIRKDCKKNESSVQSLFEMLKPAICVLLDKGIKIVIVTVGSDGVLLCSKGKPSFKRMDTKKTKMHAFSEQLQKTVSSSCPPSHLCFAASDKSARVFAMHFPAVGALVVRLTGAGDCLVGGMLASICAGLDVMQSLAVGIAVAKGAVESERNVPCDYNLTKIVEDAKTTFFAAKVIFNDSML